MKIVTMEQLEAIQHQGQARTYPEKTKIFVGMATCGLSAGAEKVFQALQEEIQTAGLDVSLQKTGCIGYCQREPLVDWIEPGKPRLTYERMTPDRARALIQHTGAGKGHWPRGFFAAWTRMSGWLRIPSGNTRANGSAA